jgi:hypothetical protein
VCVCVCVCVFLGGGRGEAKGVTDIVVKDRVDVQELRHGKKSR